MKRRAEAGVLSLLAVAAAAAQPEPDLDWIDLERVAAGEVVYRTGKSDDTATVDVALRIEAPPEAIWRVLTACAIAPEYVPHVQHCERIETLDGGRAELFVQTIKPAFFLPSFEHVFRLDYEPYARIEIHGISGPLDQLEGAWHLLPQDDGSTLLVHSLAVDPGLPIPRFIVRGSLRSDMPAVHAEVRARAERTD